MTEDKIRMATPEQLRIMVAEQLGYEWRYINDHLSTLMTPDGLAILSNRNGKIAPWATAARWPDWPNDIVAAWDLVLDLQSTHRLWLMELPAKPEHTLWQAQFVTRNQRILLDGLTPEGCHDGYGTTPEEAICRAWLLAKAKGGGE